MAGIELNYQLDFSFGRPAILTEQQQCFQPRVALFAQSLHRVTINA